MYSVASGRQFVTRSIPGSMRSRPEKNRANSARDRTCAGVPLRRKDVHHPECPFDPFRGGSFRGVGNIHRAPVKSVRAGGSSRDVVGPHRAGRDLELSRLDITVLLRDGLTAEPGHRRTVLFGDGAAAEAVVLDHLGTEPRSVAFLADTVRAGGLARAAELPEPLPRPEAAGLVREWLRAGTGLVGGITADDTAATWLRAVATITELKQRTRARGRST